MELEARILMLSPEFQHYRVGGLATHVSALAPRLANHTRIDLIVPRYHERGLYREAMGRYGEVHRVDAIPPEPGSSRYDSQVWKMNDQLASYITGLLEEGVHFDLMHAHDWLTGFAANDLHHRFAIPYVATIHATENGRGGGIVQPGGLSERIHIAEEHMARTANRIIACSAYMREDIARSLSVSLDKITVVPNGVEAADFLQSPDQMVDLAAVRSHWQPEEGPLIFSVGRLVWEKGLDLLVGAMPDVIREFPTARAVIAGTGTFRDALVRKIEYLGLEDHVQLAGYITDELRNQLYAISDIAVFPSRYEPFGIVALEAMSAGIPVVVSSTGGLCEVVTDHVTGLCVASGQSPALAAAIIEVLQNPEEAAERAVRAREVALSQYNWDYIAARTLRVYRSLLAERG